MHNRIDKYVQLNAPAMMSPTGFVPYMNKLVERCCCPMLTNCIQKLYECSTQTGVS